MKTKIKKIQHAQMITMMLISAFTVLINNISNIY